MEATKSIGHAVAMGIGTAVFAIIVGGVAWALFGLVTMPTGERPVSTCVCPADNGRPPSRRPTEDDYYSTPPGVSYAPRR